MSENLDEGVLNRFISVGGVAVLGPARLAETIAAHYGQINRVSRFGLAALSDAARAKLDESFGAQLAAGAPALGGHEVVDRYGITAEELDAAFTSPVKLGPGTYAATVQLGGGPVIVLDGFHPAQLRRGNAGAVSKGKGVMSTSAPGTIAGTAVTVPDRMSGTRMKRSVGSRQISAAL